MSKIGIFRGKEATYNSLILETVFKDGPSTNWEIAKKMYKTGKIRDKTGKIPKIHNIYGNLQRKKGRLQDLQKKQYLREENEKWILRLKGFIALRNKYPEMVVILREKMKKLPRSFELPDESSFFRVFPLSKGLIQSITSSIYTKIRNLADFLDYANEIVESGVVDLDQIKEQDLIILLTLGITKDQWLKTPEMKNLQKRIEKELERIPTNE